MTLDGIRDALVAHLHNNWAVPTVAIYYENTAEVDLATVGDYFMRCEVLFDGAEQANISATPFDRTYGTLVLTVFARQSLGTRPALIYLETLKQLFRFKNLGGVHTQAAGPREGPAMGGWTSFELRTPFYADSNA